MSIGRHPMSSVPISSSHTTGPKLRPTLTLAQTMTNFVTVGITVNQLTYRFMKRFGYCYAICLTQNLELLIIGK